MATLWLTEAPFMRQDLGLHTLLSPRGQPIHQTADCAINIALSYSGKGLRVLPATKCTVIERYPACTAMHERATTIWVLQRNVPNRSSFDDMGGGIYIAGCRTSAGGNRDAPAHVVEAGTIGNIPLQNPD